MENNNQVVASSHWQAAVFQEIAAERIRQDNKFGPDNEHPPERWLVKLVEEVGEVSMALNDELLDQYYVELIHVAATAVAAIECYKRLEKEPK